MSSTMEDVAASLMCHDNVPLSFSVITDVACLSLPSTTEEDVVCTHLPGSWHISVRLPACPLLCLLGVLDLLQISSGSENVMESVGEHS